MNISDAKDKDMVDYLSQLGLLPVKIQEPNYWYSSPLREEKTPSFKVNRRLNRWFDFGDGKGGNLVDFGILYHRCSISDFLQKLDSTSVQVARRPESLLPDGGEEEEKKQIQILSVRSIISRPLLRYLQQRKIPEFLANCFCREVSYRLKEKDYYAIGFKNDAGGYELRNEYIKASSSPKDITTINNGAADLAVFEGFFNFLSYRVMCHKQEEPLRNYLILNSTSFFEKSLPKMQEFRNVHLYLDMDKTGQKCTQQALALDEEKFKDERGLYQKYDDLNDWLMNFGQSQKQQLRQKP